jgi:DNA-binding NarL/FixJ family response regulator
MAPVLLISRLANAERKQGWRGRAMNNIIKKTQKQTRSLKLRKPVVGETTIPVYLVESHPLAAAHLQEILAASGFSVRSVEQALETPVSEITGVNSPVLIVDDDDMQAGEKFLALLRCCFGDARLLVIQKTVNQDRLYQLLLLGVRGFVAYDDIPEQLSIAVHSVWEGKLWLAPSAFDQFVQHVSEQTMEIQGADKPLAKESDKLTAREKDIVALLGRSPELSNKEISSLLSITERTVKFHMDNIFTKLGVRNRYAVAKMVSSSAREQLVVDWNRQSAVHKLMGEIRQYCDGRDLGLCMAR